MRHALLALCLVSFTAMAADPAPPTKAGEVYKWVDDKGVVHYSDKPSSRNAAPAKLPPLQTYKGGTPPDLRRFDKGGAPGRAPAAADAPQLQLVTPAPEETFRGAERTVPVAVLVTPSLKAGQQIVFMLDGKPAEPVADTSYAFTGVDRGAHTASAALVDASGNELARSGQVTFYVKPPIVRR